MLEGSDHRLRIIDDIRWSEMFSVSSALVLTQQFTSFLVNGRLYFPKACNNYTNFHRNPCMVGIRSIAIQSVPTWVGPRQACRGIRCHGAMHPRTVSKYSAILHSICMILISFCVLQKPDTSGMRPGSVPHGSELGFVLLGGRQRHKPLPD